MDIQLGDIVAMKKPHPCGENRWTIIRTGADIKIKCQNCGRIVMLDRLVFEKRVRKRLERPNAPLNGQIGGGIESGICRD